MPVAHPAGWATSTEYYVRNSGYKARNVGTTIVSRPLNLSTILSTGFRRVESTVVSVMKELDQLHKKKVFHPVRLDKMRDVKSKFIRSFIFLKRKRDSSLKSQMVADGSGQEESSMDTQTSSPTISTEALFLSTACCRCL